MKHAYPSIKVIIIFWLSNYNVDIKPFPFSFNNGREEFRACEN